MLFSPLLVDVESDQLSTEEQATARYLGERLMRSRGFLGRLDLYYKGEQRVEDLGISTPPVMKHLKTITGWPGTIVDALDERLDIEGFRYPDSVTADADLWSIWQENNLDEESQLAHLDALIFGRGFVMVGTNPNGGAPLITIESPENMMAQWDARSRRVTAALQVYQMDGQEAASIFLENSTVNLTRDERTGSPWKVVSRDTHNLGRCPVVMVTNRTRSNDRYGRSEITPAVMSITDAACRTLLGLEAAREFYAVPQRWALNVGQEAFTNPDGSPADKWDAALSKIWALPPGDKDDPEPKVGQFTAMSPAVYTNIVNMYAEIMASQTGLPPHFLGLTTTNPASADAIRSAESRLNKRAERRQSTFSGAWEEAMRLALALGNGGKIPDESKQLETIWAPAATPTPVAASTAIMQQVEAGVMPPSSRVALESLGYTQLQIERIEIDRARDIGELVLAQLAHSVEAKDARVDLTVARDIGSAPGGGLPAAPPANAAPAAAAPAAPATPPAPPAKK